MLTLVRMVIKKGEKEEWERGQKGEGVKVGVTETCGNLFHIKIF